MHVMTMHCSSRAMRFPRMQPKPSSTPCHRAFRLTARGSSGLKDLLGILSGYWRGCPAIHRMRSGIWACYLWFQRLVAEALARMRTLLLKVPFAVSPSLPLSSPC